MAKKSNYKVVAEAIVSGKLSEVEIPREQNKLSLQELKQLVEFEMDNAKADKHKAPRDGDCSWDQADPENKKDWQKMLGIKEAMRDDIGVGTAPPAEPPLNRLKKNYDLIVKNKKVLPTDVVELLKAISELDANNPNIVKTGINKYLSDFPTMKEVFENLTEEQLNELGWQDIKKGAKKAAMGAALAGSIAGAAGPAKAGGQPLDFSKEKGAISATMGNLSKGIQTPAPDSAAQQLNKPIIQTNKGKDDFVRSMKAKGINLNLNRQPDHQVKKPSGHPFYVYADKDYVASWDGQTNTWKLLINK